MTYDFKHRDEWGWMPGRNGEHEPVVGGVGFPRATGLVGTGPVGTYTMQGEWVEGLIHWPTRAEQERQSHARRREALEHEAKRLGLSPERVVELLKAAGQGEEFVRAWEET